MGNTAHSKSTNINLHTINKYLNAMKTEINLSKSYEMGNTTILANLSKFNENKSFLEMNRENIIAFLNSFRREDKIDPFQVFSVKTIRRADLCIPSRW